MRYFDICSKKTYQKDGEEKATWLKVGTIRVTDDNKQFIELNIFPTTSFYVFEQKERELKDKAAGSRKSTPADISWNDQ